MASSLVQYLLHGMAQTEQRDEVLKRYAEGERFSEVREGAIAWEKEKTAFGWVSLCLAKTEPQTSLPKQISIKKREVSPVALSWRGRVTPNQSRILALPSDNSLDCLSEAFTSSMPFQDFIPLFGLYHYMQQVLKEDCRPHLLVLRTSIAADRHHSEARVANLQRTPRFPE